MPFDDLLVKYFYEQDEHSVSCTSHDKSNLEILNGDHVEYTGPEHFEGSPGDSSFLEMSNDDQGGGAGLGTVSRSENGHPYLHILLVDGNPNNRRLFLDLSCRTLRSDVALNLRILANIAEKTGHQVTKATSGSEALDLFQRCHLSSDNISISCDNLSSSSKRFDLVITDVMVLFVSLFYRFSKFLILDAGYGWD